MLFSVRFNIYKINNLIFDNKKVIFGLNNRAKANVKIKYSFVAK